MSSHLLRCFALLAVSCLCAGQSPKALTTASETAKSTASKPPGNLEIRNNAFALLVDLLNDEKHLSKILHIKFESDEVDKLVTSISKTAKEGSALLESYSKSDAALVPTKVDLPPGEQAARKAIAEATKQRLLRAKGAEFEFELLLTQTQALEYGAHLALIVAENETQPERAQELSQLSARLNQLRNQVVAMLRSKS